MPRGNTGHGCPRRAGFSQVDSMDTFLLYKLVVVQITDCWAGVSWSKQIIEHERAEAAKEAAAAAAAKEQQQ